MYMSIWTPVIDKMLVCKPAQYWQSVCSSCIQRKQSHVALPFIVQGVYHLQYKCPCLPTWVTLWLRGFAAYWKNLPFNLYFVKHIFNKFSKLWTHSWKFTHRENNLPYNNKMQPNYSYSTVNDSNWTSKNNQLTADFWI